MKELWVCRNPANKKWMVFENKEDTEKLFESFHPIIHLVEERKIDWQKVKQEYSNKVFIYKVEWEIIQELVEKSIKGELK